MTKLQLLHRALNERLMAAVEQIMEMVGGTVLEYEEETVRARKENEILRRRLRWMEGENPTDWPVPGEADPSGLELQPVSLAAGPAMEPLAIKTEPIDTCDSQSFTPDSSLAPPARTTDLDAVDPATSTPTDAGLSDATLWDSAHSYMAPLDFDPTTVRHWRGRGRSQRMSFACPDCGKVFGKEHRLIIHMRIHSAERPYAYRRRKACFYGDKKRKRKLHRSSKTSREIVDELSDASEQTEHSAGLVDISTPTTPVPSASEVEPVEAAGGVSERPVGGATRSVGLRARQGAARSKMPRCLQCKRVFTHVSRLESHMKTHRKPLPSQEEDEAQRDPETMGRRSRQHSKKPVMRNNEAEVERARAGGQTLFQCSECKKVFARSCWLTFHLKSHERERALARKLKQRQLPGSRVPRAVSQETPELTEETTGVKESTADNSKVQVLKKIFACPYCDKVFTREGWLGPHIRSHTSKTPQKSGIFPDNIIPDSANRRSRRPIITQSLQQLKEGTSEIKKVNEESKRKNEKAEKVTEQPKTTNEEPKKNDSESKKPTETKRISNEPERTIDETNKIPDESKRSPTESSGGADEVRRPKKRYACRQCGKVYVLAGCLKTHKKMHKSILEEKRRKMREMEELFRLETSAEGQSIAERRPKRNKTLLKIQPRLDIRSPPKKQHLEEPPPKHEDKPCEDKPCEDEPCEDEPCEDEPCEDKSKEDSSKTPGRCICKHCGKIYARRNWLNLHILGHRKKMLQQVSEERQKNSDEQTLQEGSSGEDSAVQKGKDGGKASFPCPFCDKAFPRAMRLMVHMQIHSGEKPYPYRQRKEQFYGDLTRPRGPSTTDSQEPAIENTDEREKDEGIAVTRNQTTAVSQDDTCTTELMETVQPQSVCTGRKSSLLPLQSAGASTSHSTTHSRTDPKSVSNAINHFSLQPRIVLEPITAEPKHWTASGEEDFNAVNAGTSEVELHHISEVADAATANSIDYEVEPPQSPLENVNIYGCHVSQNPLSTISYTVLSETDDPEILCVQLGSLCKSRENASNPHALEEGEVEVGETEVDPELSRSQINAPSEKSDFIGTVTKNAPPFSESEKGTMDRALISDNNFTDIMLRTVPEFLLVESSSSAGQQEGPNIEPVYMIDDDDDNDDEDDDRHHHVSNSLHEKIATGGQMQIEKSGIKGTTISQSLQNPPSTEQLNNPICNDPPDPALDEIASEVLACVGAVDKSLVSSSGKAMKSASDVFIPNETDEQSDHDGLIANEKKSVHTCMPCGLKCDSEASLAQHIAVHSLPGNADKKSSPFKKLKKKFKNNETKHKHQVSHIQTSEEGRNDSTDNPEISGESDPAALVEVNADELIEASPETNTSRSSRGPSKTLPVRKEQKKEKKTLYCRFCGKACRKIELHLKYDHSREPEVVEALCFSKTPEERKKLLSHLCSKNKIKYNTDGVRSGKVEDLVHCIFCKGSYLRSQFWKHALICEEKKTQELTVIEDDDKVLQSKPRLTQKTFTPESENPIQDTICNTAQTSLSESVNALLPKTVSSTTKNLLTSTSCVTKLSRATINPTTGSELEDPLMNPTPAPATEDPPMNPTPAPETEDPPMNSTPGPEVEEPLVNPTPGPRAGDPLVNPTPGPGAGDPLVNPTPGPAGAGDPLVNPPPGPGAGDPLVSPTPGPAGAGDPLVNPTPGPAGAGDPLVNPPPGPGAGDPLVNPTPGPGAGNPLVNPTPGPAGAGDPLVNPKPGPGAGDPLVNLPPGPGAGDPLVNPPPGPGAGDPLVNPTPGPGAGDPLVNPTPGPGAGDPLVNPTPGPGAGDPLVNPTPGPGAGDPLLNPTPGPGAGDPLVNPTPGPGAGDPLVNPTPGPGAGDPLVNPTPGPGAEDPLVKPIPGQGTEDPHINPMSGSGMEDPLINPTHGPATEGPPILYLGDSVVKMSNDSESSDPPILDSFHCEHVRASIPDTSSSIAKNLNVEPLSPPVLDSCHAAPEITQLELKIPPALNLGDGQEQKNTDYECSDPPILESCHSTPQDTIHHRIYGESKFIGTSGILDIKQQSTTDMMSLSQFDVPFSNAEQPLTSALNSLSLQSTGSCDIQHNISQNCQKLISQNPDYVRECVSPSESVPRPDIVSSSLPAHIIADMPTLLLTTGSGILQQTLGSEADEERTDSRLTPDQESETIAKPDSDKGHLDSESTDSLVLDHVSYETRDSSIHVFETRNSIQVFETSEHIASSRESDSPPVLDHIPKETQQTPGPETNRTYGPLKQMFESEGHISADSHEFSEVASQDCNFKSALNSDTTTTVKRKWDSQSIVVKKEPKRSRLSSPLQNTSSEDCVASTSTAHTSEQVSGPQTSNLRPTTSEDSEGKGKFSKTHYCFYCKKPCVRITQHLQSVHPNERDVAKALSYDMNSKERKQLLDLLRSKGDFLHNSDVVQSGEGNLVPSRQLNTATSNEDYVHCIFCLGLFSRRSVANHVQRCKLKYPDRAATSCSELLPVTVSRSSRPMTSTGYTPENLNTSSPLPDTSLSEELLNAKLQTTNSPNAGSSGTTGEQENPHTESYGTLEGNQLVKSLSETSSKGAQLDANTERTRSPPEDFDASAEHAYLEAGSGITSDTSHVTGTMGSDVTPAADQTGRVHEGSLGDQTETNMSEDKKTEGEQRSQRGVDRRRKRSRPQVQINQPTRMNDDSDEESVSHNTKVHVCEHCSATFCSPYHLRRHVYTHTGERPYWCSQCNMGFIQKYRFRNHRMTHHGETQLSVDQELARSRKNRSHSGDKPANNEIRQQPADEQAAALLEPSTPDVDRAVSTD